MAQLKNKYFGELKGKLGDVVFRQKGNRNFISQTKRKYSSPNNPDYFNRLETFRLSTKFASAIHSIIDLRKIWFDKKTTDVALFNHIVSRVYPAIKSIDTFNLVKITPEKSFAIRSNTIRLNETQFEIDIEPLGDNSGINTSVETKARVVNVVWLYENNLTNIPQNEFISFVTDYKDLNIHKNTIYSINFSSNITEILKLYNKGRVYSSLITYSNEMNIINYSNTYFADVNLR